jgi:hypothetical protein
VHGFNLVTEGVPTSAVFLRAASRAKIAGT